MSKTAVHTSLYYFKLSENWIHTQIKHLCDWKVQVLTNETQNLDSIKHIPAIYERRATLPPGLLQLDSLWMKLAGYYPSFYKQAKKANAQLIHAHFGTLGSLSLPIAQKLGIPLVTTFYGYDASELPRQQPKWRKKYKALFEGGACFLVEGPAMGKKLEQLGCPPQKIQLQHLGIEPEDYPLRPSYPQTNHLRVLMAGRFVAKKGFIYGLEAFNQFIKGGGEGKLTIVGDSNGTASSDAIKQEMQAFVKKQELQDSVNFKGLIPLKQLRKEYYGHDVFLAPSITAPNGDDEGGLPVTLIEAAATGMPLTGSRHCDIPEVIKEGKTGFLAAEKDANRLTEALFALSKDFQNRRKMGQAASAHIRTHYNAQRQGKKLAQLYDSMIT